MTNNFVPNSIVNVSSAQGGFPGSNLSDNRRALIWRPTTNSNARIITDVGYSRQVQYVCLIGRSGSPITLSPGATVTLEGNSVEEFTSPPFSQEMTIEDTGVYAFLDETYRFWRIVLDDTTNQDEMEFSYLYIGDYITFTQSNISKKFKFSYKDLSSTQTTESGVVYSNKRNKALSIQGTMKTLTYDEMLALEEKAVELGRTEPFFVSIDPNLCISNKIGEMTHYVRFRVIPRQSHQVNNFFDINLSMEEIL